MSTQVFRKFSSLMKVVSIEGQRIVTAVFESKKEKMVEIFVKNLPLDALEDELIRFFEKIGPVYSMRLMMTEPKVRNRGYLYLVYVNDEHSYQALALKRNAELRPGVTLHLEVSMNSRLIFIGDIPKDKTKFDILNELQLNQIHFVVDIILVKPYDRSSKNCGYVFIEFETHVIAAKMRGRLRNSRIFGRNIRSNFKYEFSYTGSPRFHRTHNINVMVVKNLKLSDTKEELQNLVFKYVKSRGNDIKYLFKYGTIAFIGISSQILTHNLFHHLEAHFRYTNTEILFTNRHQDFLQSFDLNDSGAMGTTEPSIATTSEESFNNSSCNSLLSHEEGVGNHDDLVSDDSFSSLSVDENYPFGEGSDVNKWVGPSSIGEASSTSEFLSDFYSSSPDDGHLVPFVCTRFTNKGMYKEYEDMLKEVFGKADN